MGRSHSVLRREISESFLQAMGSIGAQVAIPDGLIPSFDQSVLFTGATISVFKPHIVAKTIPATGLVLKQMCLRSHAAYALERKTWRPGFCSYFTALGSLHPHASLTAVCAATARWMSDLVSEPQTHLRVNVHPSDTDIAVAWRSAGLASLLQITEVSESIFRHTYGMPGVSGRNCNLSVLRKSGAWLDVGNIVLIEDENSGYKSVEAAFGVETISSGILDLSYPLEASLMGDIVPGRTHAELAVIDALPAAIALANAGVRPIASNRGRVLRRYLDGLCELCAANTNIEVGLSAWGAAYEWELFGSRIQSPRVSRYLERSLALTRANVERDQRHRVCALEFCC